MKRWRHLAASVVVPFVLATCSNAPKHAAPDRDERGAVVVVASFNFPESELLAEIYAQALEARGIRIRRELNLGPRELVLPALASGQVDIVPEYVGSAAAAVVGTRAADPHDAGAVRAELASTLARWKVQPLALSPASNVNGVVVTRDTAARLRLRGVSDLMEVASKLSLGGPSECPTRPYCLVGLESSYGLHFKTFVPIDGQARVSRAMTDAVIDVGIMFTTDGRLASSDLTLLDDDRRLQPAENIVPLVRESVLAADGAVIEPALDAVSARLDTETLRFLNWRVAVAGNPPAAEARGWLLRERLISR